MARIFIAKEGQIGGQMKNVHTPDWINIEDGLYNENCILLDNPQTGQSLFPNIDPFFDHNLDYPDLVRENNSIRLINNQEKFIRDLNLSIEQNKVDSENFINSIAQKVILMSTLERLKRSNEIDQEIFEFLKDKINYNSELLDRSLIDDETLNKINEVKGVLPGSIKVVFGVIFDILAGKQRNPFRL